MRFDFATATEIIFGRGTLRQAGTLARRFGMRALVVTGRNGGRAAGLLGELRKQQVDGVVFTTEGEPELRTVETGVKLARGEECDLVISIGGGSALDAGKAIAAMLTNEGDVLEYLEVIGRGKPLARPCAPFIAIPTTAGTGSEVTRNAVLASSEHRVKVSLRSPLMLPKIALVDPELTYDLPPAATASTGLDALTQVIEPFVCTRSNPMTDAVCIEGMKRAARSLRIAYDNSGSNPGAREDMCVASLFGGVALANAGLGAVHGFAGPIGGMFPAPHGAICAALLPHVMQINVRALRERNPLSDALRRYHEIACLLTGNAQSTAEDGIKWTVQLVGHLGIPGLATYGIGRAHIAELVEKASKASSMKPNPIPLTEAEMTEILLRAL